MNLSMEIQSAIGRLNFEQIQKEYLEQDEFVFIPEFLSPSVITPLFEDVERLSPSVHRNFIPRHKKGGSVSYFSILEKGHALLEFYRSIPFRDFLCRLVRADLKLSPTDDPHACALYFYTEAGDHIGYHYDTSYYKGARYTVLLGLVDESSSRLLCRLYTRQPTRQPLDLEIATKPGTMVIFNGDKVYHAVSPSKHGERRVVLTMEYVTHQEMGPLRRMISNLKDAFAYFGVQTLWGRHVSHTAQRNPAID